MDHKATGHMPLLLLFEMLGRDCSSELALSYSLMLGNEVVPFVAGNLAEKGSCFVQATYL
eukprot:1040059-Pelagomonas_calceolata.AAC.15